MLENNWYVEVVWTPDDPKDDRTRRFSAFTAPEDTNIHDLASLALEGNGWTREQARMSVRGDADLNDLDMSDDGFDFRLFGAAGSWHIDVSPTAQVRPVARVVLAWKEAPVAVRLAPVTEEGLAELAVKLGMPLDALSVVEVADLA
jgi:hypothetical protein